MLGNCFKQAQADKKICPTVQRLDELITSIIDNVTQIFVSLSLDLSEIKCKSIMSIASEEENSSNNKVSNVLSSKKS